MKTKALSSILLMSLLLLAAQSPAHAQPQQTRTSQELSGMQRSRELEEKRRELEAEIKKKKQKPEIEEKIPAEALHVLQTEKVLIKKINVTGARLVPPKEIGRIIEKFEGKEMSLTDMQAVADQITEAYRKRGYITSRAYLPPQKIENDTFEIRVVEGKMGDLEVKGNYFYKSYLYKKNSR